MWGARAGALCGLGNDDGSVGTQRLACRFGLICGPRWVGKSFLPSVLLSDSVEPQCRGFGQAKASKAGAEVCRPPAQRPGSVTGRMCMFCFWTLSRKRLEGQPKPPHHHCRPGPVWECSSSSGNQRQEWLELQGKKCS